MFLIARSNAYSSALSIFWSPGNLFDIWVLLLGLYTPDHVVLPSSCPSEFFVGGMKEPYV
jgi:hypothetical protein